MEKMTSVYGLDGLGYTEIRFMEEVRPGVFRSSYELQNFSWSKYLELYVVVEPGKKALLIDTGWDALCGTKMIDHIVNDMEVPWENVMIFLSHFHRDHHGNLAYCLEHGAKLVMHEERTVFTPEITEAFSNFAAVEGEHLSPSIIDGPQDIPNESLYPNELLQDSVEIAGYKFFPMHTPGHTKGHISLIEPAEKFMFAGDHAVMGNPLLRSFEFDEHITRDYLESFERLKGLQLETIYMSHFDPIEGAKNVRTRFDDCQKYMERPLGKAFGILQRGTTNIWDFTNAYYSNRGEHLLDLPVFRRYMRLTAQMAFLEYFVDMGMATRRIDDEGHAIYEAVADRIQ